MPFGEPIDQCIRGGFYGAEEAEKANRECYGAAAGPMYSAPAKQRTSFSEARTDTAKCVFAGGLRGYWWLRESADDVVVLVHGIHQHARMYEGFAKRLVTEGYNVFGYDLRGFGASGGTRGMLSTGAFDQAVDDLHAAITLARGRVSSGGRLVVFGHSLGGLIACMLATQPTPSNVDAFVLSSPSVALAPALKAIGPLLPCVPGGTLLAQMDLADASNNAAFKSAWQAQPASLCDPKKSFRVAYVVQARKAILTVRRRLAQHSGAVPFGGALILCGGLDLNVHDHGACRDLHHTMQQRTGPEKSSTLKEYPYKKHELIFEDGGFGPGENEVVDDIVAWISAPRSGAFAKA